MIYNDTVSELINVWGKWPKFTDSSFSNEQARHGLLFFFFLKYVFILCFNSMALGKSERNMSLQTKTKHKDFILWTNHKVKHIKVTLGYQLYKTLQNSKFYVTGPLQISVWKPPSHEQFLIFWLGVWLISFYLIQWNYS